ncbi:hypothetical protein F4821DRAFT_249367 [Hypoxylon rubiginosum]|uniref:Uncharacterized protein n=1 Tax=Hypoxylon rubiginosum TaxID=110542 RepID=A0ACC0CM51_9PEZI|nr:hypothetical protein F4821DRAFT_249367 [Hypoxylon rubiginosum]
MPSGPYSIMTDTLTEKKPSKAIIADDAVEEDSLADSGGAQSPEVIIADDDGRADIVEYNPTEIPKFAVGKKVNVIAANAGQRGPYIIETVIPLTRQYTLADESGNSVNHGRRYEEDDLEGS